MNNNLLYFKSVKENYQIEIKESSNSLPHNFWDTYSSFSNTAGGKIILGIKESYPENIIVGVNNPNKIVAEIWNNISNPQKTSYNSLLPNSVEIIKIDNKDIIIVSVEEAPTIKKPVFINGKIENTYIRSGDGDRKASIDDIKSFLRNSNPISDTLTIDNFTLNDLDTYSVLSFKEKLAIRYPEKKYMEMDIPNFLVNIGACSRNRKTNDILIKRGTLLFLGKYNSIKEIYPHFHLDYFNRKGSSARWIDRVSDDEPHQLEMNIYNFFNIVNEKLQSSIMETFSLQSSQERTPNSGMDSSIREALINCLAHADYDQTYPSIKIELLDGLFIFKNPGQLLIPKKQFVIGGDSRPRNEIIMKLFRLIGFSERQGFGGPQIYKAASENSFRCPELETNVQFTELKIWSVDLADSYPDLSNREKDVLKYIIKSKIVTFNDITSNVNISEYYARNALDNLEKKHLIDKYGKGRATKYCLNQNSPEFITQLQMTLDTLKKSMY